MKSGFEVGQKVRFLDEQGEGIVLGFPGKETVLVQIEEGLNIPYPAKKLVKTSQNDNSAIDKSQSGGKLKKDDTAKTPKKNRNATGANMYPGLLKKGRNGIFQADLHVEEILSSSGGMNNAEIICYQLNYFQNCIEEARNRKLSKIVIIHGVGAGKLREEVRKILALKNLEHYDASYVHYGYGATEIRFR